MNLKNVNTEEKNKAVLDIQIPKKDFDEAVSKVFRKKVGQITVPGFRKGKAPRAIIEKMYGKGVFYEDALNDLLPQVLEDAVKEAKIEAVSQPDIELGDINDEGVSLKASYFTKPEIKVKNYKGIKAEKTVKKVEKEEVEAELKRVQERNSRTIEVTDRKAEMGDVAVIDYEGFVGGVAFEGGKDSAHHLTLGSGQFIPGFEEQIVGHSIGDEFDVTVTFPEEYHAEDLKGKEAVFKVALNGIEKVELPALDDEFAKDVSEFDTLAEYKKDIKAKIEKRNEENADREVEEQLLEGIVSAIEGDIPECMYETECENMLRDYDARLQQSGLNLDMYLKYAGITIEKMKEDFKPQAENQVKAQLALEYIAKKEKFKISDEDVEAEYKRVAEMYQIEVEKAKQFIAKEVIEKDIASKKAVDLIKSEAIITEKASEVKEKKAPVKKTAAKDTEAKKPAAKKAEKETNVSEKKPAAKKAPAKKKTETK